MDSVKKFFQNEKGEYVITQRPNWPIIIWALTQSIILFTSFSDNFFVQIVNFIAITTWAVQEVLDGESPFRRSLGGVVLGFIIVTSVRVWL